MGVAAELPIPGDQPSAMMSDRGNDHLICRVPVKGLGQLATLKENLWGKLSNAQTFGPQGRLEPGAQRAVDHQLPFFDFLAISQTEMADSHTPSCLATLRMVARACGESLRSRVTHQIHA